MYISLSKKNYSTNSDGSRPHTVKMDTAGYSERLAGACLPNYMPHPKETSASTVTPVRTANLTKDDCRLL